MSSRVTFMGLLEGLMAGLGDRSMDPELRGDDIKGFSRNRRISFYFPTVSPHAGKKSTNYSTH